MNISQEESSIHEQQQQPLLPHTSPSSQQATLFPLGAAMSQLRISSQRNQEPTTPLLSPVAQYGSMFDCASKITAVFPIAILQQGEKNAWTLRWISVSNLDEMPLPCVAFRRKTSHVSSNGKKISLEMKTDRVKKIGLSLFVREHSTRIDRDPSVDVECEWHIGGTQGLVTIPRQQEETKISLSTYNALCQQSRLEPKLPQHAVYPLDVQIHMPSHTLQELQKICQKKQENLVTFREKAFFELFQTLCSSFTRIHAEWKKLPFILKSLDVKELFPKETTLPISFSQELAQQFVFLKLGIEDGNWDTVYNELKYQSESIIFQKSHVYNDSLIITVDGGFSTVPAFLTESRALGISKSVCQEVGIQQGRNTSITSIVIILPEPWIMSIIENSQLHALSDSPEGMLLKELSKISSMYQLPICIFSKGSYSSIGSLSLLKKFGSRLLIGTIANSSSQTRKDDNDFPIEIATEELHGVMTKIGKNSVISRSSGTFVFQNKSHYNQQNEINVKWHPRKEE